MQIPMQVTFRGMDPSPAVEERVREEIAKLEQYSDRITGCHVVVEKSQHRHHQGNLFHVRVDLTLPGTEVVVKRDPAEHQAHEDVYVSVRDAFDAARRQIMDHVRRLRDQSRHEAPHRG